MASIRKLTDGRAKPWKVRITRKGQTRSSEHFRTKTEAKDFAAKVEADFDRWSKVLGGELRKHTVADPIDRYKLALSACYKAGIDRGWYELKDNPFTVSTKRAVAGSAAAWRMTNEIGFPKPAISPQPGRISGCSSGWPWRSAPAEASC